MTSLCLFLLAHACFAAEPETPQPELLLQSGFEGGCLVVPVPGASRHRIVGRDTTLPEKSDFGPDLVALTGRAGMGLDSFRSTATEGPTLA